MKSPGMSTDPLDLLEHSVRIYSPSAKEESFASFLEEAMRSVGYSGVRRDEAGNVLGDAGDGPMTLLLCGHMDTVPGELDVRRTNTAIFGRGASDAKAPLCALMLAGATAGDSGVKVTFAGVTREETDSFGIRTLARSGARFDYAVFGEPSGSGKVTVGYRGRVGMHVSIETAGGHAGAPWSNASAFDGLLTLLAGLRKFEACHSVPGDRFGSPSVTVTLVSAGTHHNVVPPNCDATFDVRLPPGFPGKDAISELKAVCAEVPGANARVEFGEVTEPYVAPPGSVIVRAFQRAVMARLGTKPILTRKTGTGDMNDFAAMTGSPCVTYGPGEPHLSHSDGELVKLEDYIGSIEVLKEAISQLGGLHLRQRVR